MKVLTAASFTQPNMPTVAIPAGIITTPLTLFGASTVLWLKADVGVTQNGGTVSQWQDQSATGLVLNNARATTTSTYGAATMGNKPGITFATGAAANSTGDSLTCPTADTAALQFSQSSPFAVALAIKCDTPTSQTFGNIFGFKQLGAPIGWYVSLDGGQIGIAIGTNSGGNDFYLVQASAALTVGQSYIIVINYAGGSAGVSGVTIYQDGAAVATTTVLSAAGNAVATPQYAEVGGQSNDTVGEIVVINRALSAAEVANLSAYMDARYKAY